MSSNPRRMRKVVGLGVVCLAALAVLSVILRNHTGFLGTHFGDLLDDLFGHCGVFIPVLAALAGLWLLKGEAISDYALHLTGYGLLAVSVIALLGGLPEPYCRIWAGDLGTGLGVGLTQLVGIPGVLIICIFIILLGLGLVRQEPVVIKASRMMRTLGGQAVAGGGAVFRAVWGWINRQRLTRRTRLVTSITPLSRPSAMTVADAHAAKAAPADGVAEPTGNGAPEPGRNKIQPPVEPMRAATKSAAPAKPTPRAGSAGSAGRWVLPPRELLATETGGADLNALQGFVDEQAKVIEQTLQAFRVEGKIVSVTPGTRVILFEWQLAPGVKASKLEHLTDEMALNLKAERVRVVIPLPGKGTIGIEIPHPAPAGVTFGGLLASQPSQAPAGDLPLFLGRALTGELLVADLVEMPHLLIAGTTGSGKSVCIHTILMSLLMSRTPDELRLLLIDPKRVELIAYRGSPHLLFEVIVDAKSAVTALRWVVGVMEARYRLLAQHGCRDLHAFNRMFAERSEPWPGEEGKDAVMSRAGLPWIVVAVDELADLMVAKAREVEDALQRLAQMARGVGVHLVVATQRPSVDVLTGVIKANFPSRLSFQVRTRIDSRTILDAGGAEQLLGHGDMLFAPAGSPGPQRAQASYVSPAEVKNVLEHWIKQGTAEVPGEEGAHAAPALPPDFDDGEDPLYQEAIHLVVRTGEASVSMLQRRLSIGFARAGRLVDVMEARGVVGPKQGSRVREILIDRLPEPGAGAQ